MINSHIHTFNSQYTPELFVKPFIKNAPNWLVRLINTVLDNKLMAFLLINALRLNKGGIGKYASFIEIGILSSQEQIFEKVASAYPADTKFVVLPLGFENMGAGNVNIPYEEQLHDLFLLKRKYPSRCLPFVFIDPRMGTATENLNFVKYYIEQKGFMGIKLYPSLGYYPFDSRLELVYKYADEKEIPILTHCSRGGVNYGTGKVGEPVAEFVTPKSFNPQPVAQNDPPIKYISTVGKYDFTEEWESLKDYARFFDNTCNPDRYVDVLKKYKTLKLCFAHFGFDDQEPTDENIIPEWHLKVLDMMEEYPNVYADISYALATKKFWTVFNNELPTLSTKQKDKILYGTDFFMTLQEEKGDEKTIFQKSINELGSYFGQISNENSVRFLTSKIWNVPPY